MYQSYKYRIYPNPEQTKRVKYRVARFLKKCFIVLKILRWFFTIAFGLSIITSFTLILYSIYYDENTVIVKYVFMSIESTFLLFIIAATLNISAK